jgi:hypothetical protein
MPWHQRLLEALASGLLVTMLAPPIAAAVFVARLMASSDLPGQFAGAGPADVLLLLVGALTGAYIVGAIPSFIAGLALSTLRKLLAPVLASMVTGLFATLACFLTMGSQLLSGSRPLDSLLTYGLPAFVGAAMAAFLAMRVEKRHHRA